MNTVRCNECGTDLSHVQDPPDGGRTPCPECGSTSRHISVSVSEGIRISEHVSVLKRRDDKAVGFSESQRQGRASWADQQLDGTQSFSLNGTTPQGEEDTLGACRILVSYLNRQQEKWSNLRAGEGEVDCEAMATVDSHERLCIQVVRAIVDPQFWQELSTSGKAQRCNVSTEQLAGLLRDAISKKADASRIPDALRQELHLALDATRLPGLAFDDVVAEFRNRYQAWTRSQGFAAVWLVGPNMDLTWRLDQPSTAA